MTTETTTGAEESAHDRMLAQIARDAEVKAEVERGTSVNGALSHDARTNATPEIARKDMTLSQLFAEEGNWAGKAVATGRVFDPRKLGYTPDNAASLTVTCSGERSGNTESNSYVCESGDTQLFRSHVRLGALPTGHDAIRVTWCKSCGDKYAVIHPKGGGTGSRTRTTVDYSAEAIAAYYGFDGDYDLVTAIQDAIDEGCKVALARKDVDQLEDLDAQIAAMQARVDAARALAPPAE